MTFMLACNRGVEKEYRNAEGQWVHEEYYRNDNLKSQTIFLDEDRNDYIYSSYYSDGRLRDSALYINDTVTGLRKVYEAKNGLMHYETYDHGILSGEHKAMYDNGVTSFQGYRLNGMKVGEWVFHYIDGGLITYEYYDSLGNIKYFRKYDENGNLLRESGSPIIDLQLADDTIIAGDEFRIIAELASVPDCSLTLRTGLVEGTSLAQDTLLRVEEPVNRYTYRPAATGEHQLGFIVEVAGDAGREPKSYSAVRPVYIENPGQ